MKKIYKITFIVGAILVLIMNTAMLCACNNGNDKPHSGFYYRLKDAFDNGWVSQDDLHNISYYYCGNAQKDGFEPTPKNPKTLSASKDFAIRKAFARVDGISVDEIAIEQYLGVYNGFYAIIIDGNYAQAETKETIGEVTFVFSELKTIWLWKE